jgi:hypothetical protein
VRTILLVLLPILCTLYFIDHYDYGGFYTNAFWTQANSTGQQYQQQLKDWWHHR